MKRYIITTIIIILLFSGGFFVAKNVFGVKETTSDVLRVYVWEDYVSVDSILKFEDIYGINVEMTTFDDEILAEKEFRENPDKYDLYMASDIIVKGLIDDNLLNEIHKNHIKNYDGIDTHFLGNKFDPKNAYSIPFSYGTTGIVYNTKYVDEVNSLDVLWNQKYINKIGLIADTDMISSIASTYTGISIESDSYIDFLNLMEFVEKEELISNYYNYVELSENILAESIWIASMYEEDYDIISEENSDLAYALPEGSLLWIENWVIPKNSNNQVGAELFIDFLLEPENSAEVVEEYWVLMPSDRIMEFVGDEDLLNKRDQIKSSDLSLFSNFELSDKYYQFANRLKERIEE